MWLAVRGNETVDAERAVVGLISKITTVGIKIYLTSSFFHLTFKQSLVYPVPDGRTTDGGVCVDNVPVFLEVTHRVAHGVGIFSHHEGTVADLLGFCFQFVGRQIAIIVDVRISAVGVAERQGYSVESNNGVTHRLQVGAYPTLIAQTPEDDAGVVLVALHETDGTIHVGILPVWVFTHHLVGITVTVTLLIGLVHHVDTPAVAEFVKVGIVRIVRGTQEVDVRLLHQYNVLLVCGIVHIAPRHGMVIVTVHTTQFHVLAINLKDLAHAFHTFHAQMVIELFIAKFYSIRIEVGLFC